MGDFPGRLVLFRIGELLCATEAGAVREVLNRQPATRIPGAPASIDGLINVRGELVTLVSGARLLGRAEAGEEGSVLLLHWSDASVALTVDEVVDLVGVTAGELSPQEELVGIDPAIVRAVGRHADRAFIVLDLDALFGPLLAA